MGGSFTKAAKYLLGGTRLDAQNPGAQDCANEQALSTRLVIHLRHAGRG
jgi:hypothetical protein